MNADKIIKNYRYEPSQQNSLKKLIAGSIKNDPGYLAVIGLGGTISSGYFPAKETIIPLDSSPAKVFIEHIQRFGINHQQLTAMDLFAKDSREITEEDVIYLLDILNTIENKTILITCGTYMLPEIGRIIYHCIKNSQKIIGITGSMLPAGFTGTDAESNILGTLAIINAHKAKNNYGVVFACFHGLYVEADDIKKMDLHPQSHKDLLFIYPNSNIPVVLNSKTTNN